MVWSPSQSDADPKRKHHSPPKRRAGNLELSTSKPAQPQRNERKGSKGMSKGTLRRKTWTHLNLFKNLFEAICDEVSGQLSAMTSKQHKRGHKHFTAVFQWLTVLSQWKPPCVLTSFWGFGFTFRSPCLSLRIQTRIPLTADLRCSHGRALERCWDVTSTGGQVA